jgi:hypothetical protein
MAILSGKDGTLHLGGREVALIADWRLTTVNHSREYVANDTGGWTKRAGGVRDASGSLEIKAADDRQCPVEEGDAVLLSLHLDGSGANFCEVPAIIDRIRVDVDIGHGEIVAYAVDFSGNGPIIRHGIAARQSAAGGFAEESVGPPPERPKATFGP